ncbi:MAG: hypothetical protein WA208_20775, partial [Thermoanaerobaculia bacterium]
STEDLNRVKVAVEQVGSAAGTASKPTNDLAEAAREVGEAAREASKPADSLSDAVRNVGTAAAQATTPTNELVEAAQTLVNTRIESWAEKAAEGGRGVMMSFTQLRNSVEIFKDSLIQTYGTMDDVPEEARQKLKAYEQAVQGAAAKTRDLVEAQEVARITAGDTASKIQGLGFIAQDVGQLFGETGAKIGGAAAKMGGAAQAADSLGKMLSGLSGSGGSLGKIAAMAPQVAAVTAALVAATAAGHQFATANEANRQSLEDVGLTWDNLKDHISTFTTDAKDMISGAGDAIGDFAAEASADLQVLIERVISSGEGLRTFFDGLANQDTAKIGAGASMLKEAFRDLSAEMDLAEKAAVRQRDAAQLQREEAERNAEAQTLAAERTKEAEKTKADAAKEAAKAFEEARRAEAQAAKEAADAIEDAAKRRRAVEEDTAKSVEEAIAAVMRARASGDVEEQNIARLTLERAITTKNIRDGEAAAEERQLKERLARQAQLVTATKGFVDAIVKPAEEAQAKITAAIEPLTAELAKVTTAAATHVGAVQQITAAYREMTAAQDAATASARRLLGALGDLDRASSDAAGASEPQPGDVNTITMGGRTLSVPGRAGR